LPQSFTNHSARQRFLEAQDGAFNSEALELERSGAEPCRFSDKNDVPLKVIRTLSATRSATIEHVLSTITHKEYALRVSHRARYSRRSNEVLRDFEMELRIMERVYQAHHHMVHLVGSERICQLLCFAKYTDHIWTGYTSSGDVVIIMSPIADQNLSALLDGLKTDEERWCLRPYFGCLISALR